MVCSMKKMFLLMSMVLCSALGVSAKTVYVSPKGNDGNVGTMVKPVATLRRAHAMISGGDTVCFRGGRYVMTDADIMGHNRQYAFVCNLDKAGMPGQHTCYTGYEGERPVFDFSAVKAEGYRIAAFALMADWVHLRNMEIVGVPVRLKGHTQSECVAARGGSHCIVENVAMHDGMAIGYYQVAGSHNLVLNCDAYNNYDDYSEGEYGGNVDGFGFHLQSADEVGNRISGCRAWRNSDDGYDLINCATTVEIENCIAIYNGFRPAKDAADTKTLVSAGDGNGFKCGGFGMRPAGTKRIPRNIPSHIIRGCLAYGNKANGFYSNHHLAGNTWLNNSAMNNKANFEMRNRKSAAEVVDVPGYGHVLRGNVSLMPRTDGDLAWCDASVCTLEENTFGGETPVEVTADMFVTTDPKVLFAKRNADGSLPDIQFMQPKASSSIVDKGWKAVRSSVLMPMDSAWKMVWHDEFDGSGEVDASVWQSEHGFVRNEEHQWYQKQNAYKRDGILVIEGRLDSIPNPRYREGSQRWQENRRFAEYSSSSINTSRSFSFLYGRMEVRARIPAVMGAWPAIWTLGTTGEWPSNGEIDIMEFYHINGIPHILANAAWGNDRRYSAVWNSKATPYSHFLERDPYWGERFHVWTMDWTEDYIRIYLDGELLNDVDLSKTINGSIGDHGNPFHAPQYILLNLAIGGINGGKPVPDAFPMHYEIDYVRIYQKK